MLNITKASIGANADEEALNALQEKCNLEEGRVFQAELEGKDFTKSLANELALHSNTKGILEACFSRIAEMCQKHSKLLKEGQEEVDAMVCHWRTCQENRNRAKM